MNTISIDNYIWVFCLLFFVLLPFGSIYNLPLIALAITGVIFIIGNPGILANDRMVRIYLMLYACIFIPMCLSLPDSINVGETARKILSFAPFLFIGIAVITSSKNHKVMQYFILGIGLLITLWTIDALFQYVTGRNFLGYPFDVSIEKIGGGRLTGIFYPDFRIGIIMAILSPFYFEFIRICQKKFILSWVLLIPFTLVILLAGSRNSWFMLILSCILYLMYFFYAGHHQGLRVRYLVAGILVLIAFIPLLNKTGIYNPDDFKSFLTSRISTAQLKPPDNESNAIKQRVELWESSLRVAKEHWINGIGVRGFRFLDKHTDIDSKAPIISESTRLSTHPHQITLEILLETGLIGLAGYILFWIILVRTYIPVIKNRIQASCLLWPIPVIIAVFPINMHKSFYEHFSSTIIWMLLALAIANCPAHANTKTRMIG